MSQDTDPTPTDSGLWATSVLDCEVVHTHPFDFKECRTHDLTFPLTQDCP